MLPYGIKYIVTELYEAITILTVSHNPDVILKASLRGGLTEAAAESNAATLLMDDYFLRGF